MMRVITVDGEDYEIDSERDTRIDEGDLVGEMVRISRLVHDYNHLHNAINAQYEWSKYEEEITYARLDIITRQGFESAQPPIKATEAKVEKEVKQLPAYITAREKTLGFKKTLGILKASCVALNTKAEMLKILSKTEYDIIASGRSTPRANLTHDETETLIKNVRRNKNG